MALAAALALPFAANAQKPTPPSAKKSDPDEAKARALFKDAQTAYDVGEFERALQLYTEAYKVKPLPGFLFNVAQCHRQLGNYKEAAFFFGRFIDNSKPEAANVELARTLMAEMQQRLEAVSLPPPPPPSDTPVATNLEPVKPPGSLLPPPLPPVEELPVYKKGWFWAVVGGAVVVVAGGVTAGVLASQPRVVPYTPVSTTLADIDARTR